MKFLGTIILLVFGLFILANETIFVADPVMVNVENDALVVVKELIVSELEVQGYNVVTDSTQVYDYKLFTKILRFEDERAKFIFKLQKDNNNIYTIERTITSEDRLDVFIKRMVTAIIKREDVGESKEVGNIIAEEETISDFEEPFKTKVELDLGMHLGTQELNMNYDISYSKPVYLGVGLSFQRPTFAISVKSISFFQGIGMKIGGYHIMSRKANALIYGGDFGVGYFYGEVPSAASHAYVGPFISGSVGYFFGRTNSIYLKPELRVSASYLKENGVSEIVFSANIYLTLGM